MNRNKLLLTAAAAIALIGSTGLAQAQSTAKPAKPTTAEANTPDTVAETVKPSSGMSPAPSTGMKSKRTSAEANTPPTAAQTIKPSSGMAPNSPTMMAATPSGSMSADMAKSDKPMPARKHRRMKKSSPKPTNDAAGSGSGGTAVGRVAGSTNSNSAGEPPKKP